MFGAITVGQVANSQNRAWKPKASNASGSGTSNIEADPVANNLQDQRSLQLSGANVLSPINGNKANLPAERNSIDPCLLFGTAFNIDQLGILEDIFSFSNHSTFANVLMNNNYFDIGSTIGNTSSSVTYYFYDQNQLQCQSAGTHSGLTWQSRLVSENSNRLAFDSRGKKFLTPKNNPTIAAIEPVYTIPTIDSAGANVDY